MSGKLANLILASWVLCMALGPVRDAPGFQTTEIPFRARVLSEEGTIHSGPGASHYGTDRLQTGDTVEVYQRDPEGWLAIRPPDGSFSLVEMDQLELLPDGLARVKANDAVAWVGTRLAPVRKPMWQVRLRKGEVVEILGIVDRQKFDLSEDEPDWVQIQPPSGEFRWIHSSHLDLASATPIRETGNGASDAHGSGESAMDLNMDVNIEAPADGTPRPDDLNLSPPPRAGGEMIIDGQPGAPASSPVSGRPDWSLEIEPSPNSRSEPHTGPPPAGIEPSESGWRPARQPIASIATHRSAFSPEEDTAGEFLPAWNGMAAPVQGSVHARSEIFGDAGSVPATFQTGPESPTAISIQPVPMDGSLASLEWNLSQELLKPPGQWSLEGIARDVQAIVDSATDPGIRAGAVRLQEKLRKCREIQAGYEATGGGAPGDLITVSPTASGLTVPGTAGSTDIHHQYDATGWLNELITQGGVGETRYVLQDDRGNITHEVGAAPGTNLRRYLRQRVGIVGNRGFNQQLQLNHVTAERVATLESLQR